MLRRSPLIALSSLVLALSWGTLAAHDLEKHKELLGKRMGVDGELAVRIVAQGLRNQRSYEWEDRHQLVCYFDQTVGSHFTHLLCATNEDLGAGPGQGLSPFSATGGNPHRIGAFTGRPNYLIAVPANEQQIRALVDALGGLPEMNDRLVELGSSGVTLPRDLPRAEELDRYEPINREVEAMRAAGAAPEALERVIRAAGMTVERYNRVTELVAEHPELLAYLQRLRSE